MSEFNPRVDKHITSKIESARGGEVYLFYNSDPIEENDWRVDNFQWFNNSGTFAPSTDPVMKKNYWIVKNKDKKKVYFHLILTISMKFELNQQLC